MTISFPSIEHETCFGSNESSNRGTTFILRGTKANKKQLSHLQKKQFLKHFLARLVLNLICLNFLLRPSLFAHLFWGLACSFIYYRLCLCVIKLLLIKHCNLNNPTHWVIRGQFFKQIVEFLGAISLMRLPTNSSSRSVVWILGEPLYCISKRLDKLHASIPFNLGCTVWRRWWRHQNMKMQSKVPTNI